MILCIQALKLCYMCLFRWCPSENKVSLNFQVLCLLFSPREGIWTKYFCCGGYYSFVPLNFSTFKPQINSLDKSFLLNTIKLSTLSSWQVVWFFFFFFPILIVLSSFLCAYMRGEVFQCFGVFFASLEFHYRSWCVLALHLKSCQEMQHLTSWEILDLMSAAFLTGATTLCSFGFRRSF